MLPNVQAEDRLSNLINYTSHKRILLIGRGGNEELAVFAHAQPCPTGAEAGGGRRVELILHFVKAAKVLFDLSLDVSDRRDVAGSRLTHECPEHGMVVVATSGVDDRCLDLRWEGANITLDASQRNALEGCTARTTDNFVDVVDIGLVMFGVVDVHCR